MAQAKGTDKFYVTYDWSDDKCIELANKHYFPSSARNIDVQKGIITNFLNFYLGGRRRAGVDVSDLVFAVLSIIPITPKIDGNIWHETEYKADGSLFFLSPEERHKATIDSSNNQQSSANLYPQNKINEATKAKGLEIVFTKVERLNKEINISTPSSNYDNDMQEIRNNEDINHKDQDSKKANYETKSDLTYHNRPKDFPTSLSWVINPINKKGGATYTESLEYGPVTNGAFINSVTALLDSWSQPHGRARAMLKYFFAVIALVLMRATTKGYKHLQYAFSNNKFQTLIGFSKNHIQFSTPHKRCLKAVYRSFSRRDKNTPVMFAKIINLYISLHQKHKLKLTIRNALLLHTAWYGFNLIYLWQTIINHSQTPMRAAAIANLSCTNDTQASWCRLIDFFNKYGSNRHQTFYWARVLNTQYFKDLSCSQNYELAVILAVFVEKMTGNSDIWMSTWVNSGDLDKAKEVGCTIYEIYANT